MRHVIFILFSRNEQLGGGGEGVRSLTFFFYSVFFPCPADHEQRDWPPCKKVVFSGWQPILLRTAYYAVNVKNNKNAMKRFLKKNQSTPRPSGHPPVMGEKMSKRLGGIKGCKYKTSSWH